MISFKFFLVHLSVLQMSYEIFMQKNIFKANSFSEHVFIYYK